jgi:hypothetical protein
VTPSRAVSTTSRCFGRFASVSHDFARASSVAFLVARSNRYHVPGSRSPRVVTMALPPSAVMLLTPTIFPGKAATIAAIAWASGCALFQMTALGAVAP